MIVAAAVLQNGRVFVGRTHADVMRSMLKDFGCSDAEGTQGFVTDTLRFLTREEAAEHALECGQIKKLKFNPNTLFSEDLWNE